MDRGAPQLTYGAFTSGELFPNLAFLPGFVGGLLDHGQLIAMTTFPNCSAASRRA